MFAPSVPPGAAILESAKQSIRSDVSSTFGKADKSDGLAVPDKADEWVGIGPIGLRAPNPMGQMMVIRAPISKPTVTEP